MPFSHCIDIHACTCICTYYSHDFVYIDVMYILIVSNRSITSESHWYELSLDETVYTVCCRQIVSSSWAA